MNPRHSEQLVYLKKIEGQVRGIERMIEDSRYCVDIITQIESIIGALHRVESQIFKKHLNNCLFNTLKGKSAREKDEKINEVINLISKFRKNI